jgi:hypothetical protein
MGQLCLYIGIILDLIQSKPTAHFVHLGNPG